MLTEARNASHSREWVEHIAHNETKDAFRYLVSLAAEDPRYNCYPMRKGEVLERGSHAFGGEKEPVSRSPGISPGSDTIRWNVTTVSGYES